MSHLHVPSLTSYPVLSHSSSANRTNKMDDDYENVFESSVVIESTDSKEEQGPSTKRTHQSIDDDCPNDKPMDDHSFDRAVNYENAECLFYGQRLKSFMDHNWPFSKTKHHKCNPEQLALAGFRFSARNKQLGGKCISCGFGYYNFMRDSDPWNIHKENSANCPYIGFGKRGPNEYSISEMLNLWKSKKTCEINGNYDSFEKQLQKFLLKCRNTDGGSD